MLLFVVSIDNGDASDTSNAANKTCFELMNKYIDDVENFKMVFTAEDYNNTAANRHASNEYTVTVNVVDTTSPGIDMDGSTNKIEYSNENTICRLEIDNLIQVKDNLLTCYKVISGGVYKIIDNNVNHLDSGVTLNAGKQYYDDEANGYSAANDSFDAKITLSILEEGTWMDVTNNNSDTGFPHLYKSGYHQLRIKIYDHWEDKSGVADTEDNLLTIYVTYYVNPRTLLIEPLANEKMYGEDEPLLDYCVYVNRSNDTFNLQDKFFEKHFINEYFVYIYCTRNVFEKIEEDKRYVQVAGTESLGYAYHTYTQNDAGGYLLINNTYVKIEDSMKYNMTYNQLDTGNYYSDDGGTTVYEYKDAACTFAAKGDETGNVYLKISTGACKLLEDDKRYVKAYKQSSTGTYLKYNLNNVGGFDANNFLYDYNSDFGDTNVGEDSTNANAGLVNDNAFTGKLARVESRCYNNYVDDSYEYQSNVLAADFTTYLSCNENSTAADKKVRNDNVGQYNIVLGTLSIKEGASTNYNEDYVIKLNTNYVAEHFSLKVEELGATSTATKQTIVESVDNVLVDDGLKTESNVKFTIRQAVLTVSANGSTKMFGEQDPYSNNWNDVTTPINISSQGYLGGYSVEGWRYNGNFEDQTLTSNATNYIISGTLRREVGEQAGIYDICNRSGNPASITGCTDAIVTPGMYDATSPYYFHAYDQYATDGASSTAALTIRTNENIYVTDASAADETTKYAGRTLNKETRNYAILFVKADFRIEATDIVIQPGINQGKEYANDPHNDPIWELVVYGETITSSTDANGDVVWGSNVTKDAGTGFSGYTADISVYSNAKTPTRGEDPYKFNGAAESEVYYARRKVSPKDVTYQYVDYIKLSDEDTFTKAGNYYYKDATATISAGHYIYAYGRYYEIANANRYTDDSAGTQSNTGGYLKVVVVGRLVNQTYTLFDTGFTLERISGNNVGWYSYVQVKNYRGDPTKQYTIRPVDGRTQECVISETAVRTATGSDADKVDCRNYNVVYKANAPTFDNTNKIYETAVNNDPEYMPDGFNKCNSGAYSYSCGTAVTAKGIKFEIFKREIILEFIDDNYTFIYGERYNYYDGGRYDSDDNYVYNGNTNGIFNIKDTTSEGNLFLCYSDLGDYLVDCTDDPDYGVTSGDTWTSIGLKFYLHEVVSGLGIYYGDDSSDVAVPAGTYYVYAAIAQLNDSASNILINQNYKFTYRGGTLTIKPKVTNVHLTGYTMEYGESKYASYGTGSNYSDYTSYKLAQCMNDASYKTGTGLISDCSVLTNTVGNSYGFVIEGLDVNDTIAKNFTGRPTRASRNASNVGVHDDVGYYKISVGSIAAVQDSAIAFTECATNLTASGVLDTTKVDCVFVDDGISEANTDPNTRVNARNYDISYSLTNNEGAYLFIVPANLDITVYPDQTKMYGCAYSVFKTDAGEYYAYNYDNGYTNCDSTVGWKYDLAYKYKVSGDKDTKATPTLNISEYDVTTDTNGNRTFAGASGSITIANSILTDDRLYRVAYNAGVTADYDFVKANYTNYQGQAVGVYTISLGNLTVANNSNATKCDTFNNPSLGGTKPCKNYNINYYGNSTVDTSGSDTHTHTDKTPSTGTGSVSLDELTLYSLNYVSDANGDYVLINGKYVKLTDLKRFNDDKVTINSNGNYALINKYVKISSLTKYKKLAEYEESNTCASEGGCYIYIKDNEIKDGSNNVIGTGFVLLSSLDDYRYTDSLASSKSASGGYLEVTSSGSKKYIALSTITKFRKNTSEYAEDTNGDYVLINDKYVLLSSLQEYKANGALFDKIDETTTGYASLTDDEKYVQIYEYALVSSLARYKLEVDDHKMYSAIASGGDVNKNLYVFINGSYIPYNSIITSASQTTVVVNRANVSGAGVKQGALTSDVKFTIVARIVYVHPEYNVKPYGDADPTEVIYCSEIKAANGSSFSFVGRNSGTGSYCTNSTDASVSATDKIELGVSMYYAVQNSLATAPWTVWTDYTEEESGVNVQKRATYNDVQFDVVSGKVSRKFDATALNPSDENRKSDKAGKYTYDFGDVTTNDNLSGKNYMIKYVTKTDLDATYVLNSSDEYKKLTELLFTTCNYGDSHCVPAEIILNDNTATGARKLADSENKYRIPTTNGKYSDAGTATSISLIQKYSEANNAASAINYWYYGFYLEDATEGRDGELAKWWTERTTGTPATSIFNESYDEFKYDNAANKNGATTTTFFNPAYAREVYFEIIKRTIYLYAVDTEKTYGEADKYSDFLVAICPNNKGYEVTADGIECKSNDALKAYGLSDDDKDKFVKENGAMEQWKIKNNGVSTNSDYIFQGIKDQKSSFGIYFRRQPGENAGSYTVTACAAQTGVSDCTYEIKSDSPNYTINHLGDNYEIIEIPGVLTIKTREIAITPDSDQGFQYGNYTENGSMPNITFTEVRDGTTENGLVYGDKTFLFNGTTEVSEITRVKNASDKYTSLYEFSIDATDYIIDGNKVIEEDSNTVVATINVSATGGKNSKTVTINSTEYTIIQKARCLINISGIYTVCINDAQNESLANSLGTNYYVYGADYGDALTSIVYDGARGNDDDARKVTVNANDRTYHSYNVYNDTYSDPAKLNTRKETGAGADTRKALDLKCGDATNLRYSRDVCNYDIVAGELTKNSEWIGNTTVFYIYITDSKRYSDSAGTTQSDTGDYVEYGNGLYAEIKDADLVSYMCEKNATTGKLECAYAKDTEAGATNSYLKVTVTKNNYKIVNDAATKNVKYNVTAADIEVTPVEKQYKIYGEADIEIKFTVQTEYTVKFTQYQNFANSNIVKICNDATCYTGADLNQFKDGDNILLTKGWTVTLSSYAYDEENETNKAANLDYGVNRSKYKHDKDADQNIISVDLAQTTNTIKHYDKYTTYNASITLNRILIGNLYVKDYDQTVGEKEIINGLKVGVNNLSSENGGLSNYSLSYVTKLFVIVPRPVNVEIENITKTYGQATDAESCDGGYSTECIVGDGILIENDSNGSGGDLDPNEDSNESKLVNNFNIIEKSLEKATGTTAVSGVLTVSLNTSNLSGVQVVYMSSATDYSKMNMPTVISQELASGATYKNYVSVTTNKYYTADGTQERKNATLNIKVERGTYNIARGTSTCLVTISGELCEDVGEYYLSFAHRSTSPATKEATVANAYYNKYWGYNKNYYVVVYNNFEGSGWSEFETKAVADGGQGYNSITANTGIYYENVINEEGDRSYSNSYTNDATPLASATLKIRKRPVQIVVETISKYEYTLGTVASQGTHLRVGTSPNYVYHLITETNRYNKVATDKYVQSKTGEYLCTYAAANKDANCYQIIDRTASVEGNRYNLKSVEVGERYAIETNTDVPSLVGINNSKSVHHTTYDSTNYNSITWYEHPLQVRTGDVLEGKVAYCQKTLSLSGDNGLDLLRAMQTCESTLHYYDVDADSDGIKDINQENNGTRNNFFSTAANGYYIITREVDKLYIKNTGITNGSYEANNYSTTFVNGILQIDVDETAPVINVDSEFVIKEANSGKMSGTAFGEGEDILGFLNSMKTNGCKSLTSTRDDDGDANTCDTGIVFTYEDSAVQTSEGTTPTVSLDNINTLLGWFGISSFDPGIMRAGVELGKRYDPRWYMAIQQDFDQRKTGDYSIFVYVQDVTGNISLATMVTLRIVDAQTKPTVGTINLYSAKVSCKENSDCRQESNWVVAEDAYLPIHTLSADNLSVSYDKTKKYSLKSKAGGTYVFEENNYFGTYYKIPAGTDAKAVKHNGWTNASTGIYMTITGGDDNSLTYLNTSGYQKYTLGTTTGAGGATLKTVTESASGTHLLLGSFVNVGNLTKYRQVKLDANGDESASGSTITYMPDPKGTIIRYKGYYYNLTTAGSLATGYIGTAPTIDEYKLKLFAYKDGVFTETSAIPSEIPEDTTYYIQDGEMYNIPSIKYDSTGKHSSAGTYVNFAQWNHYYSRDGGNSWAKYDRDTTSGYLVLGQDGQRLIMIKAVDNGYTYSSSTEDKTYIEMAYATYCVTATPGASCSVWNNVDMKAAQDTVEYKGEKQWVYNISDWETYSADGNRDRQYAYLDTIIPRTILTDDHIEVFEYGCSDVTNCSTNHVELFGTGIDGYLYLLSALPRFNSASEQDLSGEYVRINNELIKVEASRRYSLTLGGGTATITQVDDGDYIYLGKTDSVIAVDQLISGKIAGRAGSSVDVYDKYTGAKVTFIVATSTAVTSENSEKLLNNTNRLQSGVGLGSTMFDGVGNAEQTFGATISGNDVDAAQIDDKYTAIFVYVDVRGGSADVVGHPHYGARGYYKFNIAKDGTTYKIYRCYSNVSAFADVGSNSWCASPTESTAEYATYKEAMESLMSVYAASAGAGSANAYNFNGNEITYTIDYKVYDIAGNAAYYERKGILLSGFTRTIGISNGGAAAAALAVDVAQNASIANILNNFSIVTTTGKELRMDERVLQTIYYNGQLVSSRAAYDPTILSSLDTTVPGVYRIVYSVERKDGLVYVEGNSVELTINVKPNVATVSSDGVNISGIIIAYMGAITVGLAVLFVEIKKRKNKTI